MRQYSDWATVSEYLYSGISKKISFFKNYPENVTPDQLKLLKEAIDVYNEKCIAGVNYLKKEYQDLIDTLATNQEYAENLPEDELEPEA
ncbi:hypothetical protein Desde_3183 [Desulfitobacterium dehalogenans ATCC 51507]|uniref:Uncharacterized protein n=1 Tax=Desulfitobacterium dehalogenans (strain ATCC 51507 / DSM 9161 / JW/IU-DC1) TaxID=756499 RepID=I4ABY9_DESDJ|nr:hypothetical protein [Desulfitobacterium dehalogenans]AFM01474.1 hypothetical protein Desde_3183 [Desulfitobacterium dehalogenans ATCC 51507]